MNIADSPAVEQLDHRVVVDAGAEQSVLDHLVEHLAVGESAFAVEPDILGVVGAVVVLAEDVAAVGGQDRVAVVRVLLLEDVGLLEALVCLKRRSPSG